MGLVFLFGCGYFVLRFYCVSSGATRSVRAYGLFYGNVNFFYQCYGRGSTKYLQVGCRVLRPRFLGLASCFVTYRIAVSMYAFESRPRLYVFFGALGSQGFLELSRRNFPTTFYRFRAIAYGARSYCINTTISHMFEYGLYYVFIRLHRSLLGSLGFFLEHRFYLGNDIGGSATRQFNGGGSISYFYTMVFPRFIQVRVADCARSMFQFFVVSDVPTYGSYSNFRSLVYATTRGLLRCFQAGTI